MNPSTDSTDRPQPAAMNLGTIRPNGRVLTGLLAAAILLSGCHSGDVAETTEGAGPTGLQQTAYRVRTDFTAPLNGDAGWAADINTPATVVADQPFRLRLELESPSDLLTERRLGLQFRRNEGDWEKVLAEDFPYPVKQLTLDFSSNPGDSLREHWQLIRGEAGNLGWQPENGEDEGFLRMTAGADALLALAHYQIHWEAVEFKSVMRLQDDATAGILFGYQDTDNHYRLDIEGGGALRLVERKQGVERELHRQDVGVKTGQWIEVAVVRDGQEVTVEYEWDAYIQGETLTWDLGQPIAQSTTGIYLPANSGVDLLELEAGGETHSPRVSIISNPVFAHGEPAGDLLPVSDLPFIAGAGISYADRTPSWTAAASQGEWEFPLVIRYFSDGASVNLPGDTFDFRMVEIGAEPLEVAALPTVTLEVPGGHLGGTFVETPMRLGPWEAANGDLYFIMEPSETDNMMMMVKSSDGGKSWREVDGAHRPQTGDLEGVASTYADGRIHILHQTSDHVFHHVFNTVDTAQPDRWDIRDEMLASPTEPPVQVADIAVRSDGSVVGVYGDLHRILYRIRSAEGHWGEEIVVDAETDRDLSGPTMVRGRDDVVHLAYTGNDGTAWYRRILPTGALTASQQLASGLGTEVEDAGGILPLVYLPESDTVSLVYRLGNGELWERRAAPGGELGEAVQVTDRAVVSNAADSEQAGADAVGHGASVHVLFIEAGSGRLFHTSRNADHQWTEPRLLVDGENVLWVRGTVIKDSGQTAAYGFVYDGGSNGGSGFNRYAEITLGSE